MRVNVYAEEITEEYEVIQKTADTGATFIGVRFYLESADKLHHSKSDDDRSAVTFWVRSGRFGFKPGDELKLAGLLADASFALRTRASK